jgi:hypothetical protein
MTKRIFIPTHSLTDWQRLLAKPDLHWQPGRSAMTAAALQDVQLPTTASLRSRWKRRSFDPKGEEGEGWRDFQAFATALEVSAHPGQAALVPAREHPALFVAWCAGDQRFREVDFRIGSKG